MKSKYFNKPTIYVSHAIRGTNGDMKGNCEKAIRGINRVQSLFPEVDFYVPAQGDLVLQILYNSGRLSESSILEADLEILHNCHGYMFYHFDDSSGSETERIEAIDCGFVKDNEHDIYFDLSKANYDVVRSNIAPIVQKCIKRFRGENG